MELKVDTAISQSTPVYIKHESEVLEDEMKTELENETNPADLEVKSEYFKNEEVKLKEESPNLAYAVLLQDYVPCTSSRSTSNMDEPPTSKPSHKV